MMKNMHELIDTMTFSGVLHTPHIIDAFREVDRKYFVPKMILEDVYADIPLPIGKNQTISQPSTVAFMLEHLGPKEGDDILDIGSGSGWTISLLCFVVGEKGSVIGLERVDELVEVGKKNLSKFHFGSHCRIQKAGEKLGLPGKQFDKILVSASAEEIPHKLFDQLRLGGILVIPVKNSIFKFEKISDTKIKSEEFEGFVFVPLIV
jgi:protein-L-isoaspartate(D-aspartate) O-methyltransferase